MVIEQSIAEQSIAQRHAEQSTELEFENRKLHSELTLPQNMLADRKAIEERDIEVACEEEHQAVTKPTSKPNAGEETIMFGVISVPMLIIRASIKK